MHCGATRVYLPTAGRSSSIPAGTRDALPRTSSLSASLGLRIGSGGVRRTSRLPRSASRRCASKVVGHLGERDLYVVDAFAGADPAHRIRVRVVTTVAFHALFARTMFITPSDDELEDFEPEALVLHAPGLEADPAEDGVRSGTFIALHPTRQEVLIGGTFYAGEIKKSVFTLLNDRLPLEGVFPMHCSANVGDARRRGDLLRALGHGQDDALGRSERQLIGDDEHGWGDSGVFNFEGGCYAKVIKLSRRSRARDLRDHAHLRHAARERRRRRARPARSRQRGEDREHPRRLQARTDLERAAHEARGPSDERRLPDRGRVRDHAAARAAHERAGALPLPLRLHREARRHRDRRHRACADLLARASAGRSCRSRRRSTRSCSARS